MHSIRRIVCTASLRHMFYGKLNHAYLSTTRKNESCYTDTNRVETVYRQINCFSDNYIGFIHHVPTGETACVDPGDAKTVLRNLKKWGWSLNYILATHHHHDHIGGNMEIKEATGCTIVGSKKGKNRIPGIDIALSDGEEFQFKKSKKIAKVMDLPGHTIDHIGFMFEDDSVAFVGDTLFPLGCGRLFEGTPAQMWNSLSRIVQMPHDTTIFVGHEYTQSNAKFALHVDPTNKKLQQRSKDIDQLRSCGHPTVPFKLGLDILTNPFLRPNDPTILQNIGLPGNSNAVNAFRVLREMKDVF